MDFSLPVSRRTRSKWERYDREKVKCRRSVGSGKKRDLPEAGTSVRAPDKARGSEKNPISLDCDSEDSESREASADEIKEEDVFFCGEREQSDEEERKGKKNEASSDVIKEEDVFFCGERERFDEEERKGKKSETSPDEIYEIKEEDVLSCCERERSDKEEEKRKKRKKMKKELKWWEDSDEEEPKKKKPKKKSGIQDKKAEVRTGKRKMVSSESEDDRDFPENSNKKQAEKDQDWDRVYLLSSSSGSERDELERKTPSRSNRGREKRSSEHDGDRDSEYTETSNEKHTEKEEEKMYLSSSMSESESDEKEEEKMYSSSSMSESESDEIENKAPVRVNHGRTNKKLGKLKIAGRPVSSQKKPGEKKTRKRKKSFKIVQNLLELMSLNRKGGVEGINSGRKEKVIIDNWKFKFTDKEEDQSEKSEIENELNSIWAECGMYIEFEKLGSSTFDKEERASETEVDQDMLCQMGIHSPGSPIIDEEFGAICQNCREVIYKSKDVMPELVMKRSEQADFRGYERGGDKLSVDALGQQFAECEPLSYAGLRACPKTAWDLIPGVREGMYQHQRDGFEFIWKHIAGGIKCVKRETVENFKGTGCIVSHAPGTGKSRLAISFLQCYMKVNPTCLPVIIAPKSVLLTWEDEFRKWNFDVPFHNLNTAELSGKEDTQAITMLRRGQAMRDASAVRVVKLFSWKKGGSVLGVNYSTFETMVRLQKDEMGQKIKRVLLNDPGLLILDEGHIPRNENSLIWKALSRVKTRKRIILSGTPFQNNFNELYNTMQVINPKFAETFAEEGHRKGRHESQVKARKEWVTLTKPLNTEAGSSAEAKRLKDIRKHIDPIVHIHRGHVLEESLPGLRESIVVLEPFELQRTLLREISTTKMESLQLESAVALVSVHPSLIPDSLKAMPPMSHTILRVDLKSFRSKPYYGVKTWFLVNLIRLCTASNERVLVFSQYLQPLSLATEHLKSEFGWSENKEILYIDGNRHMEERQSAINSLNDAKSEARVLLVSTKAGGEGINLVGASRVVLLDVVWNPSVERQATRRAYRLGQKKTVYIYHLIASGTREEKKCSRKAEKDRMSNLVFAPSSASEGRKSPREVVEDKVLDAMVQSPKLKDMFVNISVKSNDLDPVEDQI